MNAQQSKRRTQAPPPSPTQRKTKQKKQKQKQQPQDINAIGGQRVQMFSLTVIVVQTKRNGWIVDGSKPCMCIASSHHQMFGSPILRSAVSS